MEIDFNPGQVPKPELSQPIARKGRTPAASDSASVESVSTTDALRTKLNEISLVRPEKVSQAKTLISDVSYPPTELLDRIAALLAVHLKH
jgi:hypothetical protein